MNSSDAKLIFEEAKALFAEEGLPVVGETKALGEWKFSSGLIALDGGPKIIISVYYEIRPQFLAIYTRLASFVPEDKINLLNTILNKINHYIIGSHFYFHQDSHTVLSTAGFFINEEGIDEEIFQKTMDSSFRSGKTYFPLLLDFINGIKTEQEVMTAISKLLPKEERDPSRDFKKARTDAHPYETHATSNYPSFPTHTHGLAARGWPEFLVDPCAISPEGNAELIDCAYDYFSKPENALQLKAVLAGNTLKISARELRPLAQKDFLTYCFRQVPFTFEAVILAYVAEQSWIDITKMKFIQICIEGDTFALDDNYYKYGVWF